MQYMARTEVYSWRVTPRLKIALEDAAKREGVSVAGLLERIAEEWLGESRRLNADDEREQGRLHKAAMRYVGSIEGDDPHRAERAGELIRERLRERRGATQRAH
jgi:hypothetical protein